MNSVGSHCMCNCCDETKKKLADLTDRLERLEQRELNGKSSAGIEPKFVDPTNVEMSSPDRRFTSVVAEHVGVVELKETIMWKHRPLKIIWALLLIVGAGATIYYIVQNTIDYLGDNTATRVSFQPLSEYPFPPFVVCPPWPVNVNDVLSTTGMSLGTLNYSLSWIYPQDDDTDDVDPDIDQVISFASYLKNNNYTDSVLDYFSNITTSPINVNDTEYKNHTFSYICSGCDKNQTQEGKQIYSKAVCYTFKLSPMTNSHYISLPTLKLVNNDNMGGLLPHTRSHWMFDILPNVGQDGPHMRLDPGVYIVTINTHSFKMLEGRKCKQNWPSIDEDGDPLGSCREDCLDGFFDLAGLEGMLVADGTELVNATDVEQSSNEQFVDKDNTKLINVTEDVEGNPNETQPQAEQWVNIADNATAKANRTLTVDTVKDCLLSCKPACHSRVYTVSVMKQESYEHENTNASSVYLTFEHLAWRRGYVLAYEEVDTMTFSDFISNVGGTFGLFLGCTILTVAQLILTFCHYIVQKKDGHRH